MLFNSYIFIFLFLPLTAFVFYFIGQRGRHRVAMAWLVAMSLVFYAWWNPAYLGLILGSILFNYALGIILSRPTEAAGLRLKAVLTAGVLVNLGLLAYFKYANFFVDNVNAFIGTQWELAPIILPLAISFFTFQQIAYLADAYRGETREYNFLHYCLFVTFFPQLIAGPIVHHKEMLPQFARNRLYRYDYKRLSIGTTIFLIGLFKKVVLADGVAVYAEPVFSSADTGQILTFFEAWCGALAYTAQLYFDFSGYSDMAIGLAHLFGIELPLNFNSPYKSTNIIDFWRRWHMTLSRFLRDYLYFSLGGNRCGFIRRYANLLLTMLLGGLWHGAGWTFIVWGALHGMYLMLNHAWLATKTTAGWNTESSRWWSRLLARTVTFIAVVVGWVFFRAESFQGAVSILQGMAGFNGIALPNSLFEKFGWSLRVWLERWGWEFSDHLQHLHGFEQWLWIVLTFLIAWLFPNTQEIMARSAPAFGTKPKRPGIASGLVRCHWTPSMPLGNHHNTCQHRLYLSDGRSQRISLLPVLKPKWHVIEFIGASFIHLSQLLPWPFSLPQSIWNRTVAT